MRERIAEEYRAHFGLSVADHLVSDKAEQTLYIVKAEDPINLFLCGGKDLLLTDSSRRSLPEGMKSIPAVKIPEGQDVFIPRLRVMRMDMARGVW